MAVLENVSVRMKLRSILSHGFVNIPHRFKRLIIDLDPFFCLLKYLQGLRDHKADGIPHTAGDIALRDHHVPVLHDMPHLVVRHILRGQDSQHARHRLRPAAVYLQDTRPRISRADSGRVNHALHVDVVRIFAVSEHLFPDVHAESLLAHAVISTELKVSIDRFLAAQDRRRQLYCLDDLFIARTAANISSQGFLDLIFAGRRVAVQQCFRRHHHSRGAKAALNRSF